MEYGEVWQVSSRQSGIAGPIVTFALAGLAVLALVAVAGALALRSLSTSEAIRDARRVTALTGRGIVQPALTTRVVRGNSAALAQLDRIVHRRVLAPDVARVKVWNAEGKIIYSDEPRLIGRRFPLGADELQALRSGSATATATDLSSPENTYERGLGDLTSVYLGLRAHDGTPVLYEEYLRSGAIAGDSRTVARLFAPVGLLALLVLALLQVPLAWRMAHRIQRAQQDRQLLLERAVDASDRERREIASGLHDGVVQELAGQSFQMAAALEGDASSSQLRRSLELGSAGTRNAIRQLRSLLLEIYPPALREHGLTAAVSDLAASLTTRGIQVAVEVDPDLVLPGQVEQMIYRAAQEAVRNAAAHAAPDHVGIEVSRNDGAVLLRVTDDGRGFDEGELSRRKQHGHMGLTILRDLAESAGGALNVRSAPGAGTTLELEVPAK